MPSILLILAMIVIYTCSNAFAILQNSKEKFDGKTFVLDPIKLDLLFKRASLMAMMKSIANQTIHSVPVMKRIWFTQCLAEDIKATRTPAGYAMCLVKLLDANKRITKKIQSIQNYNQKDRKNQLLADFHAWRWKQKRKSNKLTPDRKFIRTRRKRNINPSSKGNSKKSYAMTQMQTNVELLRKLQTGIQAIRQAREFFDDLGTNNMRIIRKHLNVVKQEEVLSHLSHEEHRLEEHLKAALSAFGFKEDGINFLSPRLFSILPDMRKHTNTSINTTLLSPNLLSFSENGGHLSLPSLFNSLHLGNKETNAWLEFLMQITGIGKRLKELSKKLEPLFEQIEATILPAIQQIEQQNEKWKILKKSFSGIQRREVNIKGYTALKGWQQKIMFGATEGINNRTPHSDSLEASIRQIASLGKNDVQSASFVQENGEVDEVPPNLRIDKISSKRRRRKRKKRQSSIGGLAPDIELPGNIPRILFARPFAFDERLGGVILEGLFLSPFAFYKEVFSPEFLTIHVLSPVAFWATIFSPEAMIARVLEADAFRFQLFSPMTMSAFVLQPEVFFTEVLSPISLEVRAFSPRSLFFQLLGPSGGLYHVASPEIAGIFVLSPYVLGTYIESPEIFIISILSPRIFSTEIFGGVEHYHLEAEEQEKIEPVEFKGWPGQEEMAHHSSSSSHNAVHTGGEEQHSEQPHEASASGHEHPQQSAAEAGEEAVGEGHETDSLRTEETNAGIAHDGVEN